MSWFLSTNRLDDRFPLKLPSSFRRVFFFSSLLYGIGAFQIYKTFRFSVLHDVLNILTIPHKMFVFVLLFYYRCLVRAEGYYFNKPYKQQGHEPNVVGSDVFWRISMAWPNSWLLSEDSIERIQKRNGYINFSDTVVVSNDYSIK